MPGQKKTPGQEALFESRNLLFYGDNLDVLREHVLDDSIDLIYLDPPFNKGKDYNIVFAERGGAKPAAQITAFEDTWHWDQAAWETYQETVRTGPPEVAEALQAFRRLVPNSDMLAYLSMMAPRLVELRRVLRRTGSIYLHCDPTASHYLKLLMDAVFGPSNFRNELIWKRTSAHSSAKRYGPVHDTLLFYTRSERYVWNPQYVGYSEAYLSSHYRNTDDHGRAFTLSDLTAAGVRKGSSGQPWRTFDPATKGTHWKFTIANLERLDSEGRIYWPKKGWPRYRRYLDEVKGVALQDVWVDVDPVNAKAAERLGYPTQKPLALIERIIEASSNEGETVLDPFCGCGTTIDSAQRLGRRWVGIDITQRAIEIIEGRLREEYGPAIKATYEIRPEPASEEDAYKLAEEDKHAFQDWALRRIGAYSAPHKKGGDKGIDGRMYYHDHIDGETKLIVVSVKGGATNPGHVRDLRGVMEREKAALGVFVTRRKPTTGMKAEAAEAGEYFSAGLNRMVQRLQIITVENLFDPDKKKRPVDFPAEAAPMPGAPGLPEPIPQEAKRR